MLLTFTTRRNILFESGKCQKHHGNRHMNLASVKTSNDNRHRARRRNGSSWLVELWIISMARLSTLSSTRKISKDIVNSRPIVNDIVSLVVNDIDDTLELLVMSSTRLTENSGVAMISGPPQTTCLGPWPRVLRRLILPGRPLQPRRPLATPLTEKCHRNLVVNDVIDTCPTVNESPTRV